MKIFNLIFLAPLVLIGCRHEPISAELIRQSLAPSELNQAPEKYDGNKVQVKGYLLEGFENHALWDSKAAAKESHVSNCISVVYSNDVQQKVEQMNRSYVVLSGVFRKDITDPRKILLGLCNKSAIVLDGTSIVLSGASD